MNDRSLLKNSQRLYDCTSVCKDLPFTVECKDTYGLELTTLKLSDVFYELINTSSYLHFSSALTLLSDWSRNNDGKVEQLSSR